MRRQVPLLFCALLIFTGTAQAIPHLTPIGTSGEPSLGSILDTLYGAGNYTRVDDGSDQWWTNPGSAGARAEAKYAGYTQNFGYVDGGGVFNSLFTVTAERLAAAGRLLDLHLGGVGQPLPVGRPRQRKLRQLLDVVRR